MLTEDVLKRTEGLPDGHYAPVRLLHFAHIANDQMLVELVGRKEEWNKLVQEAKDSGKIGVFTVRNPWFHPDDCFEYLITNIHYNQEDKDGNGHIFVTQLMYCSRLYGSRVIESTFKTCHDYDDLHAWLQSSESGFERYHSLEKLMKKMTEWLV